MSNYDIAVNSLLFLQYGLHDESVMILPYAVQQVGREVVGSRC